MIDFIYAEENGFLWSQNGVRDYKNIWTTNPYVFKENVCVLNMVKAGISMKKTDLVVLLNIIVSE